MNLYLVRHGIAIDREDPACPPEAERFLTTQGVVRTEKAAKGIRRIGVTMQAAWSSPYVRAIETAEIVARALKFPSDEVHQTPSLLPGAPPAEFFEELQRTATGVEHLFCFGHAPNIDLLVMAATGAGHPVTSLKKAGMAILTAAGPAGPGAWQIEAVLSARVLRTIAEK